MIPEARNFFRVYFPQNCSTITFSLCKYYSRSLLSTLTIFFHITGSFYSVISKLCRKMGTKKNDNITRVSDGATSVHLEVIPSSHLEIIPSPYLDFLIHVFIPSSHLDIHTFTSPRLFAYPRLT